MDRQRRTVHFSGSVQGVVFRYTAARLAEGFDVAGYVRNLSDERVEIVVEGPLGQIEAFLQALRDRMGHYVDDVSEHVSAATGEYGGFGVRL